jgi:NodT family efflux transporter outer membrane factor (OMF) lipoprotein
MTSEESKILRLRIRWLALPLLLAGCAVGPNYHTPPLAAGDGYPVPAAPADDPGAQRFMAGQDAPTAWWTLFGSAQLNALVEQALAHSPTLASVQATLRAAREDLAAARGGFMPALSVGDNQTWERYSSTPGQPGAFYAVATAQANVSYTFDLFGGQRRAVEAIKAQVDYAQYEATGAALTLSANVATMAIQRASLRDQIAATQAMIEAETGQVALIQARVEAGGAAQGDLLTARSQLESLQASLAALAEAHDRADHRLAILIGQSPAQPLKAELRLDQLTPPRELPASLPSRLVQARPDVRAQAAVLHQASAQIGVAEANMLPQITLNGSYAANLWSLSAGVSQPLFMGGALNARRRGAIDTYEAARNAYRATVLSAFQNVADVLSALDHDGQALRAATAARQDAEGGLDLVRERYAEGAVASLTVLIQQQQYQQARLAQIQAVASRDADTVALYQALGGGY